MDSLALIRCASGQQEVDVDGQSLAMPVCPVLCLEQDADFIWELHKHHGTGCSEVQPHACTQAKEVSAAGLASWCGLSCGQPALGLLLCGH